MRLGFAVASLLLVASSAGAADPVYLDELIEMPLATLQQQYPNLKSEGCYQLAEQQFLHISIHRRERKPWRVTFATDLPCRKADTGPVIELRSRSGLRLGDNTLAIMERLGRPDASAPPNNDQKRLGEVEYFYICRVSEGCARHTSVFVRNGLVTAISEWYSE